MIGQDGKPRRVQRVRKLRGGRIIRIGNRSDLEHLFP